MAQWDSENASATWDYASLTWPEPCVPYWHACYVDAPRYDRDQLGHIELVGVTAKPWSVVWAPSGEYYWRDERPYRTAHICVRRFWPLEPCICADPRCTQHEGRCGRSTPFRITPRGWVSGATLCCYCEPEWIRVGTPEWKLVPFPL